MKIQIKDEVKLKKWLIRKGFSNTDLAKTLGVSKHHIGFILKGTRSPSPSVAKQISDILECDFNENFEIVENQDKN
ncbi:helix-turn-helix transcriptional regulator [Bacillus dakarensis]|uniref:helix-turn-helix transcriptional regulator n=1 Tax=Robertmurraya dakarensis TaxID=1926278 RepID=UPI000980D967|nr:helix-turn-helix transcriptional regulator [Bacillus dakarensis]